MLFQRVNHVAWATTPFRLIVWNLDFEYFFENHHTFNRVEATHRSENHKAILPRGRM
jgi:hypothetical protein